MKAPASSRHRPLFGQPRPAEELSHSTLAHRSTGVVGDPAEASCEEIFDRVSGPFGTSLRACVGGQV
jgi:hypothetical protein